MDDHHVVTRNLAAFIIAYRCNLNQICNFLFSRVENKIINFKCFNLDF